MSGDELRRFERGCERVADDLHVFVTRFELTEDVAEIRAAAGNAPGLRLLFHLRHALEQSAVAALLRTREMPLRAEDRKKRLRASVPELLDLMRDARIRARLERLPWRRLDPDAGQTTLSALIDRGEADLRAAFAPIEAQGEALFRFRNHEVAHTDPSRPVDPPWSTDDGPADGPWPTYGDVRSLIGPANEVRRLLMFMRSGVVTDPATLQRGIREENRRHLAAIKGALIGRPGEAAERDG